MPDLTLYLQRAMDRAGSASCGAGPWQRWKCPVQLPLAGQASAVGSSWRRPTVWRTTYASLEPRSTRQWPTSTRCRCCTSLRPTRMESAAPGLIPSTFRPLHVTATAVPRRPEGVESSESHLILGHIYLLYFTLHDARIPPCVPKFQIVSKWFPKLFKLPDEISLV